MRPPFVVLATRVLARVLDSSTAQRLYRRFLAASALLLVTSPGSGLGPDLTEGTAFTLEAAVAETLRSSYELRLGQSRVDDRLGAWTESSGVFDGALFSDFVYRIERQVLIRDEVGQEIRRRVPLEFTAIATPDGPPGALDRAAILIESGAPAARNLIVDECRNVETQFIVETPDEGTAILCLDSDGILTGVIVDSLAVSSEELDELLDTLFLLGAIGQDIDAELEERIRESLLALAANFRAMAASMRIQRALLGALPTEGERTQARFELGYRRTFRNGIGLVTSINFQGREVGYANKPQDPNHGGSLTPATFDAGVGFRLQFPLSRGRGRLATSGSEQASELAHRAEQQLLLHSAAEQALATVRAYWDAAASAERLRLLEESVDTRGRILELTSQLVDAQERPGADIALAKAQLADAKREVANAKRQLVTHRFGLSESMGRTVDQLEKTAIPVTPLPIERIWSEPSDGFVARRYDLAAAASTTRAGTLLQQVSDLNLRREIDLLFTMTYNGFHDSYELSPHNLDGYWKALTSNFVGPSYGVGLRFGVPFGNQAARGRLLRATAARAQSEIREQDLARQIALQIEDLATTLQIRQAELERATEAEAFLRESLEASDEQFRIGDISLLDLLTTEQQLLGSQLQILERRREIAQLGADLAFESGTLLRDRGTGVEEFDPLQFNLAIWTGPDSTPSQTGP